MIIYSAKSERKIIKETKRPQLVIEGRSFQKQEPIIVEREDSLSSEDSIVDYSHNDDVYVAVQELSQELKAMARSAHRKCTRLEYDTINAFFRKAQDDHIPPPHHIRQAIANRAAKSICLTRPNIDIYQLLHDGFDTNGLIPGLSPQQQLEILKIKERLILIDRWEEVWNQVRTPKNGWYALSTIDFSFELKRHNSLLKSKKLQKLQEQTRESLIELYDNKSFY